MTNGQNIVSLDLGTSSVRAFLYGELQRLTEFGAQIEYEVTTTSNGGVEIDPALLLKVTCDCLDILHAQMSERGKKAIAVGISTFSHCFVGIDDRAQPTAPIIHLFDTRSLQQARRLREQFDTTWLHDTAGCMPHTSYWPAKLMWLRETRPDIFQSTGRWLSVGAFFAAGANPKSSGVGLDGIGKWFCGTGIETITVTKCSVV